MKPLQDRLEALDGLRCFAAIAVAMVHLVAVVIKTNPPLDAALAPFVVLAGMGMSLFFVLSGFVIHANYSEIGSQPSISAIKRFAWARFSRLVPLYLVLIAIDLYIAVSVDPENFTRARPILPYYLTLTQSWIYGLSNDRSLIYQLAFRSSVTWSISVEVFLYLFYVPAARFLVRIRSLRTHLLVAAAVFVPVIGALLFGIHEIATIDAWAGRHYGPAATLANGAQDSFVRWVFYFAPYPRILEFLCGALAANFYMRVRDRSPSPQENRRGAAVTLLLAAAALVLNYPVQLHVSFLGSIVLAPLVAAVIFGFARYRHRLTAFMSAPPLVKGGEASYSIYLLHMTVYLHYACPFIAPDPRSLALASAKAVLLLVAVICIARLVFVAGEMPARDWLRGRFGLIDWGRRAASAIGERPWLIVVMLLCHIFIRQLDLRLIARMVPPPGS